MPTNLLDAGGNIVLPKATGTGIKVDVTTPTFGWKDLIGQLTPRVGGAPAPSLGTFRGTGIQDYAFNTGDIIDQIIFHIPHDYFPGSTQIFIHPHWAHNGTAISGNLVINWYFSYAKGYQQEAFNTTLNITQTIPVDITTYPRWYHNINELQFANVGGTGGLMDIGRLEVDGILRVGLTVTTIPTISGGTPNNPYIFTCDLHYQTTQMSTKDKNFPFYI